jgi:hypothetical protein
MVCKAILKLYISANKLEFYYNIYNFVFSKYGSLSYIFFFFLLQYLMDHIINDGILLIYFVFFCIPFCFIGRTAKLATTKTIMLLISMHISCKIDLFGCESVHELNLFVDSSVECTYMN